MVSEAIKHNKNKIAALSEHSFLRNPAVATIVKTTGRIERHFMAKIPSPKIKDQLFSSRKKRGGCTSACSCSTISFQVCLTGARENASSSHIALFEAARKTRAPEKMPIKRIIAPV
jgi:hypothetical protein